MAVAKESNEIVTNELPLSPRVQWGLQMAEEGRFLKKQSWDRDLSILNEDTKKLPLVKRKALAIRMVLSEMPVSIQKNELVVGSAILARASKKASLPEYATSEEKKTAAGRLTSPLSVWGHSSPSYLKYLKLGINGLQHEAMDKLEDLRQNNIKPEAQVWYESVIISLEGLKIFVRRYNQLAFERVQQENDPARKIELQEIASMLQPLFQKPPQTFHQALQAVWFAHIAFVSTMNLLPLGRMDQYLWPFLKRDLESKFITMDKAQELVDFFWLKCNDLLQTYSIQESPGSPDDAKSKTNRIARAGAFSVFMGGKTTLDRMYSDGGTSQQFLQTVTIGGLTPEGQDGTNPLTYLCLNATYRLRLPQPCIYVRFHDDSPHELFHRVADCVRAGCVGPTLYNDDVIVTALEKLGVPIEHARDYTSDGCWEPHIQGRTYFKHGYVSASEALDRVISPSAWKNVEVPLYIETLDPFRESVEVDPYTLHSFEQIMEAFKETLDCYVKGFIEVRDSFEDGRLYDIAPLPLLSAFVEGPLETGKDITQGGIEYIMQLPELSGLSHVADSLAVIKRLCFETQSVTWKELLDAVHSNWKGKEYLRQWVRTRVPAYGCDIDYVDDIAKEIVSFYIACIKKHRAKSQSRIKYVAGIATYENYTELGVPVGATPDGRFAGETLSSNASPSIGRAVNGQTAAVNSYLKLPLKDLPGGSILDLSVESSSNLLVHLEAFIASFLERGGNILSIAVNDSEKLRAAQKEPEKYRDLKVRVGGYDAYFVDLPPHHQELQIRRCEQYAR